MFNDLRKSFNNQDKEPNCQIKEADWLIKEILKTDVGFVFVSFLLYLSLNFARNNNIPNCSSKDKTHTSGFQPQETLSHDKSITFFSTVILLRIVEHFLPVFQSPILFYSYWTKTLIFFTSFKLMVLNYTYFVASTISDTGKVVFS